MPRTLSETERTEFLAEPHIAVLSISADADGRPPLSIPVWYHYRPGGEVTFFTGTQGHTARKTRLLERAGAFSLTVQQPEMPYRYVTVECAVTGADRDPGFEQVHAITARYLPEDMARGMAEAEVGHPDSPFVLFTGRPERWISTSFD